MDIKIVSDSSSDLLELSGVSFASVPLKIVSGEREYVDDARLDVSGMVAALSAYKGTTSTSCPNVGEWLEAFGDAEGVFTVAITSNLSGSHNAAVQAAGVYMEEHPDRRVCCLDSLSTGPEMALIILRLRELIREGHDFDTIEAKIREYMTRTHLLFMLERVDNLARNGRVSPLIATAVGLLGIRIVGKASDEGTLQQLHKCRGERKGLEALLQEMAAMRFAGGRVYVAHVCNEALGYTVRERILERWPGSEVTVIPTRGLCSFYAERGGVLVGFESR